MGKVCSVCRLNQAVKLVFTANRKSRRWKCQSCLDRRTVSFIKIKHPNGGQKSVINN